MLHSKLLAAVVIALGGMALSSPSLAQGRHDDKPHGTAKPAPRSAGHPPPHTSGRHSDMMHGSSSMRPQDGQAGNQRPSTEKPSKPPAEADSANNKPAESTK